MLRLRGIFIMKCILKKNKFSNKNFKKWIITKGLNRSECEDCYTAYRLVRDNEDAKNIRIRLEVADKVLNILEKELKLLEAQIHGK